MPNIIAPGLEQTAVGGDLSLVTNNDILADLPTNDGSSAFKVRDSDTNSLLEVDSDGNTRVFGNLTVDGTQTSVESDIVHIGDNAIVLNEDITLSGSNSSGGTIVKRVEFAGNLICTDFTGPNTITTSTDPSVLFSVGDAFWVAGSEENDGLFVVSSLTVSSITINTSPTLFGARSSIVTESPAGTVTANNSTHTFMRFNESNDRHQFGSYSGAGGSETAFDLAGFGAGGAAAFNLTTNPDLSASGTSASNSAANSLGANSDALNNSTADTIQGILDDFDTAIDNAGASFATPAFSFDTSASVGAASTVVRSDATIAIFDATVPSTIEPDDAAAAGSAGVAARRDHVHAIASAAPSGGIAVTNSEGVATSFSRSDHQHDHGDLSGLSAANPHHEGRQIEVNDGNFSPSNYTAAASGDGEASFTSVEDHLRGIDTALASAGVSFAVPAFSFDTSAAAGSASTAVRSDATIALFDATTPAAIAITGAVGTAGVAARRDHVHAHGDLSGGSAANPHHEGRQIEVNDTNFSPSNYTAAAGGDGEAGFVSVEDHLRGIDTALASAGVSFAVPAFSFDTSAAAGSASTAVRSDATIAIFDATVPTTIEPDDAAATGSAGVAARRDHTHAIATAAPSGGIGASNDEGSSTSFARADHQHLLDADGPAMKFGNESVSNSATSVSVTFSTAFSSSITAVIATLESSSSSDPHHTLLVTSKSTTGFTVTFSGTISTANYSLNWQAFGS